MLRASPLLLLSVISTVLLVHSQDSIQAPPPAINPAVIPDEIKTTKVTNPAVIPDEIKTTKVTKAAADEVADSAKATAPKVVASNKVNEESKTTTTTKKETGNETGKKKASASAAVVPAVVAGAAVVPAVVAAVDDDLDATTAPPDDDADSPLPPLPLLVEKEDEKKSSSSKKDSTTTKKTTSSISSLADILMGRKDLSLFVQLLLKADLMDAMKNTASNATILAPSDDALKKLPKEMTARLQSDKDDVLTEVLLAHVIASDVVLSKDLTTGVNKFTTVGMTDVTFSREPRGAGLLLDGGKAKVTEADITAVNGVVHVIDTVLLPPTVDTATGVLSEDASSSSSSSSSSSKESVSVSSSSNSTIPLIPMDVMRIIASNENTTQLKGLMDAYNTSDSFKRGEVYTVFAPIDSALNKLEPAQLASVLADPNSAQDMLNMHVVQGAYGERELEIKAKAGDTVETIGGHLLPVTITENGTLQIGNVSIVSSPTAAANARGRDGVVHLLDGLLMPSTSAAIVGAAAAASSTTENVEISDKRPEDPEISAAIPSFAAFSSYVVASVLLSRF